jgi:hypothetical protein
MDDSTYAAAAKEWVSLYYKKCHACGGDDIRAYPLSGMPAIRDRELVFEASCPVVPLVCTGCGYIALMSPITLGTLPSLKIPGR